MRLGRPCTRPTTLILLFAFMVVSARLHLGGFYTWVTHKTGNLPLPPHNCSTPLIVIVAGLSAVFSNDIICLAMAPVLIQKKRGAVVPPFCSRSSGAHADR